MLRYLTFAICLTGLSAHATDLPSYLRHALANFNPAVPQEWAYTITTQRGDESSVERFDPSLPTEQQWTLLQHNNRPATAEEISRSGSYRISTSANTHASFNRGDIDLGTFHLFREDENRAEFRAHFREDIKDPMLHRLELQLSVSKTKAIVERFTLQLMAPYSPILTVNMLELRVETTLSAPTEDRPSLPVLVTSRFRGRVLLIKSIEEDVRTSYSDFIRVRPFLPQPPDTAP